MEDGNSDVILNDAEFDQNVQNVMSFALDTDSPNVNYSALSANDFLSSLKYQMRNVARTISGDLAVFTKPSNAIVGVLTTTENVPQWKTSDLETYELSSATETKDISLAEFKLMIEKRFKAEHIELTSNYDGLKAKVVEGDLVVTFPQNFLKWDAIHGYNSNNYNVTAHLDKEELAQKLSIANETNVTASGTQSFKITLQGKSQGTSADNIDVVLTAIQ